MTEMTDVVAIVDVETTGTDPEVDQVIEVGLVTYSIAHARVIDAMSVLVHSTDENPAHLVNGIPAGMLKLARPQPYAMVREMLRNITTILAHNAEFDRGFLYRLDEAIFPRHFVWVDTCGCVEWPRQSRPASSLVSLCLEHGVGVTDAHRALTDCLLIARLLTRCADLGSDLGQLLAPALRPTAKLQALVSYEERQLAKDAGFRWQAETKQWTRTMAEEDAAKLPFRTRKI